MQIVFDFVEGKIPFDEFWKAWTFMPEIGRWLDKVANLSETPTPPSEEMPFSGYRASIKKYCGGSVVSFLKKQVYSPTKSTSPKCLIQSSIFIGVTVALTTAYPNVKPTDYYLKESNFYTNVAGDAIGGLEVDNYIEDLLQEFPPAMGKVKRLTAAKEKLRRAFHIEGRKYPRWAQAAEWPMGKNSPMAFVQQKRDGDLVMFTFQDVDTKEKRVVEQFY